MLIKLKTFTFLFSIFIYNSGIYGYSFKYSDEGKLLVSICNGDKCSPYGKVSGEKFREIYESNLGRDATIKYLGENKAYLIYNAAVDTYRSITKDYIDSVEYTDNIANGLMLINNRVHSAPMCRDRALALADNTKEFSTPPHVQCHADLDKINNKDVNIECSQTTIFFESKDKKNKICKNKDKLNFISEEFCNSKELSTSANKVSGNFALKSFFDKHAEIEDKLGDSAEVVPICISTAGRDRIKICKEASENLESTCPLNPCNSIWNHIMTGVYQKDSNGNYSDQDIIKLAEDRHEELIESEKFPKELVESLKQDAQGRGQTVAVIDVGMTYAKETDKDGNVEYKVHPELYEDKETIKKLAEREKVRAEIDKDREGYIKALMENEGLTRVEAEDETYDKYNEYIPVRLRKEDFRDYMAKNEKEGVEQKRGAEDKGEGLFGHGTRMAANMNSARAKPDGTVGKQTTVGYAEKASVVMYKTHPHPAVLDIGGTKLKRINNGLRGVLENNRKLRSNVNTYIKENFDIEPSNYCGKNNPKGLSNLGCWIDILRHKGCSTDNIGTLAINNFEDIKPYVGADKDRKCKEVINLNNKYYQYKTGIISMSLGTNEFFSRDEDYNEMKNLLKELRKDGVILVAAAGNDADIPVVNSIQRGLFKRSSPCIFEDVICVTGNSAYMTPWRGGYSYFGGEISLPADTILTSATKKVGKDGTGFDVHFSYGTSYATSGFAALVSRALSLHGSYALDTMYPQESGVSLIREILFNAKENDQRGCSKFTLNQKSSDKNTCTFTPVTCDIPDTDELCGPEVDVDTLSERLCKNSRRGKGFGHGILTNFQNLMASELPDVDKVKDRNLALLINKNMKDNFGLNKELIARVLRKKNLTRDDLKRLAMLSENKILSDNIDKDKSALALYELTSNERKSYFTMGKSEREMFLNLSLEHKVAYTAMDEREKNRVLNMSAYERTRYLDEDEGTREIAMGMDWNKARNYINTPKAQRDYIFTNEELPIVTEDHTDIDDPTSIISPKVPSPIIKEEGKLTEPDKFKDKIATDDVLNENDFILLENTVKLANNAIDKKEEQDREDKEIEEKFKNFDKNINEFLTGVGDENQKYKDLLLVILEIYPDLKQYINHPNSNRPCPYNFQMKFNKLISSQE